MKYGYLIFWRGKKYEHRTDTGGTYAALKAFCAEHRIPEKRWHEVTVMLAEKNEEPVVHSTSGI